MDLDREELIVSVQPVQDLLMKFGEEVSLLKEAVVALIECFCGVFEYEPG